jgi:quercetin dioxygenase-like cupin family protein
MLPITAATIAQFHPDHRGKAEAYRSAGMLVGVDAFEPGQSHAAHCHADQEKLWMVLEGRGSVEVSGVRSSIGAGELVVVPAGEPHGLYADAGERMVVLVVLAPGPRR